MTIGKGAYGKVKLAESQNKIYAIKIISKIKLATIKNFVKLKNG